MYAAKIMLASLRPDPPADSLFRRKFPCSAKQNSLFRIVRELMRKSFSSLRIFAAAMAETARFPRNSLIISLLSGNSSDAMAPLAAHSRRRAGLHQLVDDRIHQRLERGVDDVGRHPDGGPALAALVLALDQDPRDRLGAGVEDT